MAHNFGLEHISTPFIAANFVDVEKSESLLYFTSIRGLEIYTWNPVNPQFVSRLATNGWAFGIDVSSDYVYVADHYNGVCIIDVADSSSPEQVSHFNSNGDAYDIVVADSIAYLADGHNGLVVLNVADPLNPYLIGHCSDIGSSISVTLEDSLVYVGTSDSSLKIMNISDPTDPYVMGEFPYGPAVSGLDAWIEDTFAYINCSFYDGSSIINMAIVNVRDPTNPTYVAGVQLGSSGRGIEKAGDYVYVNGQYDGIYIIDVGNPVMPCVEGRYDETQYSGYGLAVQDNLMIVPHSLEGFSVVDVADPENPVCLWQCDHIYFGWDHPLRGTLACEDNLGYLYLIGQVEENHQFWHSLLEIIDINDPMNPVVCGELLLLGRGYLFDRSLDYPYLGLTLSRGPLSQESLYTAVVDISNPYAPEIHGFVEGGGITEVQVPYVYSLTKNAMHSLAPCSIRIRIGEINDELVWIDSLMYSNVGYDLAVRDTFAYITTEDSLIIICATTGDFVGAFHHGRPYAQAISLDYPFLSIGYRPLSGTYGFLLFDVSDAASPSLVSDTMIYEPDYVPLAIHCQLKDTLLFCCHGGYGFDIWKIDYPDSINRILTQETPNVAYYARTRNDLILICDRWNLEFYRIIELGMEEIRFIGEKASEPVLESSPNPFVSATEIRCQLHDTGEDIESLHIGIYDVSGRLVRQLLLPMDDTKKSATVSWGGTDDHGNKLPQGVYFIKLDTGRSVYTEKIVLLK